MFTPEILEDKNTLLLILNEMEEKKNELEIRIYNLEHPDKVGLPLRPPADVERAEQ